MWRSSFLIISAARLQTHSKTLVKGKFMADSDTQELIDQELKNFAELLNTFADMINAGDEDPVLDDGTELKNLAQAWWVDEETGKRVVHFRDDLSPTTLILSHYGINGAMLTSTLGSDSGSILLSDKISEALARYYFG